MSRLELARYYLINFFLGAVALCMLPVLVDLIGIIMGEEGINTPLSTLAQVSIGGMIILATGMYYNDTEIKIGKEQKTWDLTKKDYIIAAVAGPIELVFLLTAALGYMD